MNTPTLYSITADMNAILSLIEDGDGELTPELEQALAITEEQFTQKAEDYGHAILNLKAMATAAKAEKDRLASLQKFYENATKRLTDAITAAMQAFDVPKVETPTLRLSLRKSTATEIDDLNAVPDRFKQTKVEVVAKKDEIKKAIQAGETVEGAHLIENVSLQIK
jgi:hypothetical protein